MLPKKKPRTGKERIPQPKNTVAMLNELRHGLVYKLESQTGPVHAPLFTISVEVSAGNIHTNLFFIYFNGFFPLYKHLIFCALTLVPLAFEMFQF